MPAAGHGTNETERFFTGLDRRLGVDAGSDRKRSLALSHKRAMAADKRLVRPTVRTRRVPTSGGSVEESREHRCFRLASIRGRTAFLCRRAYRVDNLASPILASGEAHTTGQILIFASRDYPAALR
jgi:hypothetical protein